MSEMNGQMQAMAVIPSSTGLAPVVASALAMLQQSPPEVVASALERILAAQERFEAGEARKSFARAVVAAKGEISHVIRTDAENKFVGYKYSTLAAVVDAATPALSRHGISVSWDISTPSQGQVTVICRLTHSDGHVESSSPVTTPIENTTTAAGKEKKTPAQAILSAATTLRRVTLMSALGLSSGDEITDEATHGAPRGRDTITIEPTTEAQERAMDEKIRGFVAEIGRAQTISALQSIAPKIRMEPQVIRDAVRPLYDARKTKLTAPAPEPVEIVETMMDAEVMQ